MSEVSLLVGGVPAIGLQPFPKKVVWVLSPDAFRLFSPWKGRVLQGYLTHNCAYESRRALRAMRDSGALSPTSSAPFLLERLCASYPLIVRPVFPRKAAWVLSPDSNYILPQKGCVGLIP